MTEKMEIGEAIKGEHLPDMLKFASWASLASSLILILAFVPFILTWLSAGVGTSGICCILGLFPALLIIFAIVASGFGGYAALMAKKGAKTWLMISAITSIVVGLVTFVNLLIGGFILYVILADDDAKVALERMSKEEWDQHPRDFQINKAKDKEGIESDWSGKEYPAD